MKKFLIRGPFKVQTFKGKYGRGIDTNKICWEELGDYADCCGCYIFARRAGKGYVPIYIGKTKRSFKQECFHEHKLKHYNQALIEKAGTPVMFFVIYEGKSSKELEDIIIPEIETFLIAAGARRNPDLKNGRGKKIKWSIQGAINHKRQGKPTDDVQKFKSMMGFD